MADDSADVAPATPTVEVVLDSVPEAVIVVDQRDRVTLWNRASEALFGWKAEEVLGERLPTVPDDEAWEARRDWIAEVVEKGQFEATTKRRHKDGSLLDVVVRYCAISDPRTGEVVAIAGTVRPATLEVQIRRLRDEREKFAAVLDAIHDGLVVIDGGIVTAWNHAAERLTGYVTDDVAGRASPIDLEAAAAGLEVTAADGTSRWIQTVSTPGPGKAERIYLMRDVTEQRRLDQAKELFFASTSHELKTPLTVVKGMAATLRQHWERMSSDNRSEALDTILRRVDQLDLLIDRILVGSRVSAGVLDVHVGPVDLAPIVEDMAQGFDAVSENHSVVAFVPEGLPLVAADRQAVDTILGHLLENAVKYSPAGGEVAVNVETHADSVRITVTDEGVGIEGDLEELLRPFVQGERRVARRFSGVGIGLFIVRQLVDALGGQLSAENRGEQAGAAFSVSLPVWERE